LTTGQKSFDSSAVKASLLEKKVIFSCLDNSLSSAARIEASLSIFLIFLV
tara:strand:+ start:272 stop:421 length:150 start_codon:yes stop_codon:yes gene_type:complete